jgi:hypothetical protein
MPRAGVVLCALALLAASLGASAKVATYEGARDDRPARDHPSRNNE